MNELRNFISENDIPITESKFREMETLINKSLIKQAKKEAVKEFADELLFRLEAIDSDTDKMYFKIIKAMSKERGVEDD